MKKIILFSCIVILMPLCAFAATINVPGDQPTIQAGIDAAADGDIVLLADGTYTGVGNYDVDLKGKSITVKSSGGADVCTIDCEGNGRGFLVYSGETVTFEGLTIKNGDAGEGNAGGGIYANQSSLTVIDCRFLESIGGAVYSEKSPLIFSDCSFVNNDNGVQVSHSFAFTNCAFLNNGRAVFCSDYQKVGSLFTLTNCTFKKMQVLFDLTIYQL